MTSNMALSLINIYFGPSEFFLTISSCWKKASGNLNMDLSLNNMTSIWLLGWYHNHINHLILIPFLLEPTQHLVHCAEVLGTPICWGLQVWTASASEVDASSPATDNWWGTAQEKEASLWACCGWRKHRWGATSASSTLQANGSSWCLSGSS